MRGSCLYAETVARSIKCMRASQMLKTISADTPGAETMDHTPFFLAVEDELQKVNQFYLQTLNEVERGLRKVRPAPYRTKSALAFVFTLRCFAIRWAPNLPRFTLNRPPMARPVRHLKVVPPPKNKQ